MYRLGDLPRGKQGIPIDKRKTSQVHLTRETAYWDPDMLVEVKLPSPIQTSEAHIVC